MSTISPPPIRERLRIVKDAVGNVYIEWPHQWEKWFNSVRDHSTSPVTPPTYTTATIPAAANYPGGIIYVSNAAAGSKFQGSNGSSWVSLG